MISQTTYHGKTGKSLSAYNVNVMDDSGKPVAQFPLKKVFEESENSD